MPIRSRFTVLQISLGKDSTCSKINKMKIHRSQNLYTSRLDVEMVLNLNLTTLDEEVGVSGGIKGDFPPPRWRLCPHFPPPVRRKKNSQNQKIKNQPFWYFFYFCISEMHFPPRCLPPKILLVPPLVGIHWWLHKIILNSHITYILQSDSSLDHIKSYWGNNVYEMCNCFIGVIPHVVSVQRLPLQC